MESTALRLPDNPILNNPYQEPAQHYATDLQGNLDYGTIEKGRRLFVPEVQVVPGKHQGQKEVFAFNEAAAAYGTHLINLIRKEVGQWRAAGYPDTTRVTRELLAYWFPDSDSPKKKLFFAQREAVETAVWLNEVAARSNAGTHVLNQLRLGQQTASSQPTDQLPRVAFKMATGTGKTVVMAGLILYHYLNRRQYRQDVRFADYFLLVAPGITIRDRLGVLRVDTTGTYHTAKDYYHERQLVPPAYEDWLPALNDRLVIVNYHQFEPRTLQGNKRGVFDGKIGVDGKKQEEYEDYAQVFRRLLGNFRPGGRLLVLNDEAHHCYLPQAAPGKKKKTAEGEEAGAEENARAAVWFSGLRELSHRFQLAAVYDLSATPYYLTGSGYRPYTLFPWIVTDFGLVEAIESGLVKIPYLPEKDDTQALDMPVLRNLYEHVKDKLPKIGKATERREKGAAYTEKRPDLPQEVVIALDQLVAHYEEFDRNVRTRTEQRADLFTAPPVLIVVCNNTSVSKEVYKHIAGYEYPDPKHGHTVVQGHHDIFSNYHATGQAKHRPPTLLIDSDALENSGQIDEEFRRVFQDEIRQFRQEYRRLYPARSADDLTDADLLREVVNTVGRPGKLGAHVRCVVSVSMLTEGWDANTVTHILGLRAFGSQLLCEQVAGRALRRRSYELQGYDAKGQPTTSRARDVTYKFPPEYARIIGIPFKAFRRGPGGGSGPAPGPDLTVIRAVPERQPLEIIFPNLTGYREEIPAGELRPDFAAAGKFELDYSKIPTHTVLGTAFSDQTEEITLKSQDELRDHEVFYDLASKVIRYHFTDLDGQPLLHYFAPVRQLVEQWYHQCLTLVHQTDPAFKRLVVRWDARQVAAHINQAIVVGQPATERRIRPVPSYYNPRGSTRYVQGQTSRPVFETTKSHVNYVVADTQSWEQICAKVLEDLPQVLCYVKNAFLDFRIPYLRDGREADYVPDFLARVRTQTGQVVNLIIEVTGMNKDKQAKKLYTEHYWLPAVNEHLAALGLPADEPWAFVEISEDEKYFRNQLVAKIEAL
ncbi:type III restriction enzyme [Hymenobacter luteus]|uniref:Type III restriction enzyme n=2 Tax=Hymenobacter TaxID=89966 RepID=A0A7W9WB29_9BACT|nr:MULTISPECIES: DEAD/DEAH box helicase family protein [Hymenobacter]MBB4600443.1 type III restriction enzyme [Hymenobacter latericoloratus]MBB6057247.1 type III restriction enzyme [Hymenobacter luteus]